MGDEKSFLDLTMDDLRTGADFERENPPGKTPTESANPQPDPTGGPEKLVFQNLNGAGANDTIIDIPNRVEFDQLTEMLGGKDSVPAAAQDLREVVALAAIEDLDEELAGLTSEEANRKIVEEIKNYRSALANPEQAQALLAEIYAHPMREPGKSYFTGKGSPALNDAIAKLWQATTGEPVVGRARSKGDGWIK